MCRLVLIPLGMTLMLAGCGAAHTNAIHPDYTEQQYKLDQQQCRSQNSTIVMASGYDDRSEVKVDAAKAQACMADRGWLSRN